MRRLSSYEYLVRSVWRQVLEFVCQDIADVLLKHTFQISVFPLFSNKSSIQHDTNQYLFKLEKGIQTDMR